MRNKISQLVFEQQVLVIEENIDQYGRIVGKVYKGSQNIGEEQVRRGMAWVYRK